MQWTRQGTTVTATPAPEAPAPVAPLPCSRLQVGKDHVLHDEDIVQLVKKI